MPQTPVSVEQRPIIDMRRIAAIESSNNPKAYNKSSGARGLYQVTDICRRDYNQMTGENISPAQLYDPAVNEKVSSWYFNQRIPQLLVYYGQPVTTENVLSAYNAGFSRVGKPLPDETVNYIKKYKGEL